MNAAHFHLLVNHVSFFALLIGIIALGISMRRKSADLRVLASCLFVVAGVFVWIAFQTGEGAEEMLKALSGSANDFVDQHAQAAVWARRSGTLVALIALAMEWAIRKKKKFVKALQWALLIFGLHGCTVYLATSFLGGQVSHPELRSTEKK